MRRFFTGVNDPPARHAVTDAAPKGRQITEACCRQNMAINEVPEY